MSPGVVDIVVVNWNTKDILARCLDSILLHTDYPYHVYAVDNGSTDGSQEYLAGLSHPQVTVILNQENLGYSGGCNRGARAGNGRYIIFLNSDVIVTPGWLTPLVRCMESDPRIAVVGPKTVDKQNRITGAGVVGTYAKPQLRGFLEPDAPGKFDQVEDCLSVSGAAYMIRRDLIPVLGLFDERFFFYYEETDYSYNAKSHGYRVVYCPESKIYHLFGASSKDQDLLQGFFRKGGKLFREKWKSLIEGDKLPRKATGNKLTAMMIVRNEANRYLKMVLDDLVQYVDEIVILDDNSTDNTYELCATYPKVVVLDRVRKGEFGQDESVPRWSLWQATLRTNPDWILAVDADEVFENRFKSVVRSMINQTTYDWYAFRFYHFWHSMTHYRVDKLWAPINYGPRLVRYIPGARYTWHDKRLHGGSIPPNIYYDYPGRQSDIRIKHYGYAAGPEETRRKYEWYVARDPSSQFCPREHYDSMLDPEPVLEEWKE